MPDDSVAAVPVRAGASLTALSVKLCVASVVAVPSRHLVAQRHRAVVVGCRRDRVGAVQVVRHRAVVGRQSRHAQRGALNGSVQPASRLLALTV